MGFEETAVIRGVTVLRATERALLCDVDGDEVWIPKSQPDDDSELTEDSDEGDCGTLVIPQWLADEKGIG